MRFFLLVTALLSGVSFASQAKNVSSTEKRVAEVVMLSLVATELTVAHIEQLYVTVWFSCGGYGTTYYAGNPTWEQICEDAIAVDDEICGP